jgi:alpha-tubulin suppressor-like RCC1 family protein
MTPTGGTSGMTGGASGASGASGVGGEPVDECMEGTHDCDDDPPAMCVDTETGFTCTCPSGYEDLTTGGSNCVNIDECDRGTDQCDNSPAAMCTDNDGSYSCACPAGYQDLTSAGRNCIEINECGLGTDTCDNDPDACVDGLASYTCECPDGFADTNGNGSVCDDIDECLAGTDACDDDPVAACDNTTGGYTCTCPDGYVDVLGDGSQCVTPDGLLALGNVHTCAIEQGGRVKCWGSSLDGESGRGTTSSHGADTGDTGEAVAVTPLGGRAVQIAAGCAHTCALLENGDVKCWGNNRDGQLGLGDTENRGDGRRACVSGSSASCSCVDPPTNAQCSQPLPAGTTEMGDSLDPVPLGGVAIAVTAGCEASCALLETGAVKCWGDSEYGQLGRGNQDAIGDAPGEVEALAAIPLGASVKKVQAGYRFVCAQLANDALKCWGRNANGQLGQNHRNHIGDGAGELAALTSINLGSGPGRTVNTFSAGDSHTCALLDNDSVKCWGAAYGYGDSLAVLVNRGDGIVQAAESNGMGDEMGNTLATLSLNGTPIALAGQHQACALFADQTLSCWGLNSEGQLGLGDTATRGDGPGEMGTSLPKISLGGGAQAIAVFASMGSPTSSHTCALLDSGAVKCWGDNARGQLGIGATQDRGDGPGEMGDALPVAIQLW